MSKLKSAAKWVGGKLVGEFTKTLREESSNAPGDWITPLGQITLEAGRGVGFVAGRVKAWSETKRCIVCRGTPTCPDCKKCGGHCKCAPEVVIQKGATEYECPYCLTMQPVTISQCPNCHGPRPAIR